MFDYHYRNNKNLNKYHRKTTREYEILFSFIGSWSSAWGLLEWQY